MNTKLTLICHMNERKGLAHKRDETSFNAK